MRPSLRWPRWPRRLPFAATDFSALFSAVGPLGASLGFAAFYAIVQALMPGSSHASFAVSVALSLVLSTAYLRTRALWVSWGLNFGWKASRALLFGLAVSGVNSHSPVVQGDPMGPFWLTGGGFGAGRQLVAFFVLLAALPVVYRLTRDLDYQLQRAGDCAGRHSGGSGRGRRASMRPRWVRPSRGSAAWCRFCPSPLPPPAPAPSIPAENRLTPARSQPHPHLRKEQAL